MDQTTINSPIQGKAYEYANVLALVELVQPLRPVIIEESNSLAIAKSRYLDGVSDMERTGMLASAKAGIKVIIKMEPRIVKDGTDPITITIQPDNKAKTGDVRDILIIRRSIEWEIGISVKHNHEALKHSRLSNKLDFGKAWYGIPSSESYFEEIRPVFSNLKALGEQGMPWRNLPGKEQDVYMPILNAFMREIRRAHESDRNCVTAGLIKYLLGSDGNDYYKLIHYNNHTTRVILITCSAR